MVTNNNILKRVRKKLQRYRNKVVLAGGVMATLLTGCSGNGNGFSDIEKDPSYHKIELKDLDKKVIDNEHLTETEMQIYVMKSFNERHVSTARQDGGTGYYLTDNSKAFYIECYDRLFYTKDNIPEIQYTYFTPQGAVHDTLLGEFKQVSYYGNDGGMINRPRNFIVDITTFEGTTLDGCKIKIEQHYQPNSNQLLETMKTVTQTDGTSITETTYPVETVGKRGIQKRISKSDNTHKCIQEFDVSGNIIRTADCFYRELAGHKVCDRVNVEQGKEHWTISFQYYVYKDEGQHFCELTNVIWSCDNKQPVIHQMYPRYEDDPFIRTERWVELGNPATAEDYAYVSYNQAEKYNIKEVRNVMVNEMVHHKVRPNSEVMIAQYMHAYNNVHRVNNAPSKTR